MFLLFNKAYLVASKEVALESFINSFRNEVAIVLEDRVMFYDIKNASNSINAMDIDADELY